MANGGDGIPREGWIAAIVGLGLAVAVVQLPFARSILSYFTILVHEMGHSLTGWLYGYPSIPAFDFVYGGGITSHTDRVPLLAGAVQVGLLWLAWIFRRNRVSLVLALGLNGLFALTAWTALHEPVITAMGHGTELLIAGIFIHRALSGRACHHGVERITYAFVGFFVTVDNLRFAWLLTSSPYHRAVYEESKGGGHWMDFSVLAEHHLHTTLEQVAGLFFVLCLVAPVVALIGNHFRGTTAGMVMRLRQV